MHTAVHYSQVRYERQSNMRSPHCRYLTFLLGCVSSRNAASRSRGLINSYGSFGTHSSRLTWAQGYDISYLDAFAICIVLCCGKSEHRG